MLKGAVARRYAQAIFEIGEERETVDRWLTDVRLIAEYFGNRRLTFILGEPNIPFARKELVVRDLLGDKVQQDALGLALLLTERGLVELAPRIRDEFERRYNEYHHQAVAEVTTAMPLDDALRESLRADLEGITGKRILLREHVDPSILGGAIARVGDTLLDGSIRRRLTLLRHQMEQGGGFFGGPDDGGNVPPDTIPPDIAGPGGGSAPAAPGGSSGSGSSGGAGPAGPAGSGQGSGGAGPYGGGPGGSSASTSMAPRAHNAPRMQPAGMPSRPGQSGSRPNSQDRRSRRGKGRR